VRLHVGGRAVRNGNGYGDDPASSFGLRRDCLSVPQARTDKKWPPRRAADVELIVIKEFTFQSPRPERQAWLP
jgi:hypothetical protein